MGSGFQLRLLGLGRVEGDVTIVKQGGHDLIEGTVEHAVQFTDTDSECGWFKMGCVKFGYQSRRNSFGTFVIAYGNNCKLPFTKAIGAIHITAYGFVYNASGVLKKPITSQIAIEFVE